MESLTVAQMIVFPVCSASASRCSLSDLDWQCLSTSCIASISGMEMVNVGVCFTALLMLCVCAVVFCILRHNSFSLIINNLISISHPHMQIKSQMLILKNRKFFSSILPIKRNLLTYLDVLLVTSLTVGVFGQVFMSFCGQSRIWSVIPIIHIPKYTEVFENDEKIPIKTNPQCGGILIRLLVGPMHHHLGIFW